MILFDDCFKPESARRANRRTRCRASTTASGCTVPASTATDDRAAWPTWSNTCKDMVGAFANDRRVLAWELYNEPTPVGAAGRGRLPLGPRGQAFAAGHHHASLATRKCSSRILELSDVISFHHYGPLPAVKAEVAKLAEQGRPLCAPNGWRAAAGSRFETHLPFFKEQKIGCWNWGFVAGRTQTFFPWGSKPGSPEPALWFHDILRRDGTPYRDHEAATIRYVTGRSSTPPPPLPQPQVLIPTANAPGSDLALHDRQAGRGLDASRLRRLLVETRLRAVWTRRAPDRSQPAHRVDERRNLAAAQGRNAAGQVRRSGRHGPLRRGCRDLRGWRTGGKARRIQRPVHCPIR